MKSILLATLIFSAAAKPCELLQKNLRQIPFRLSDGTTVPVPTIAKNFNSYAIYGLLNLSQTIKLLQKDGLSPLNLGGQALGVLSVYDYKESDMGPFQEAYFVILLSGGHRSLKPALFHVNAWSASPKARLASIDIWGIPSQLAQIEVHNENDFKVSTDEGPLFEMHFGIVEKPLEINQNFSVFAVGPDLEGKQDWSPIEACRKISIRAFSAIMGDRLIVTNAKLNNLFRDLKFKPLLKEIGRDQQAVQYLPQ